MRFTIKRFMPIIIKRHSGENPQEVVQRGDGEVPETNSSNASTTEAKCRFKKFVAAMRFKKATTVQSATKTDLLPGESVVAQEEKVLNVCGPKLILRFGLKEQDARDSLAQMYNFLNEQVEQLKKFIDVWNNQRTSLVKWKLKKCFCIAKLRKIMKVYKSMQKSISKSKTMEDLVAALVKLAQKHQKLVDEQEKHIQSRKWCSFFEKNQKTSSISMEQIINNVYGQLFAQYECYQKLGQLFKIVVDRNPDLNQKAVKKLEIFKQLTKDIPFIKGDKNSEDQRQGCVSSEAATPALLTEIDFPTIGDNLDLVVQANDNQEVNADTERAEGDVLDDVDDADGGDEEVTAGSIQISEQMEVLSNLELLSFEAEDDWPSYEEGDVLPSLELGDELPIPPPSPDPFDDDEDESTFEPDPTEDVMEVSIDKTLVADEPQVPNQALEIQGQEEAVEQDKKDDQLDEMMPSHRNEEKSITQKETINPESRLKENVLDEPTGHIGATKVSSVKERAETCESILQNIKSNYNQLNFAETTSDIINNEKETNPATSCGGKSDSNDSHSLRSLKRLQVPQKVKTNDDDGVDISEQKLKIQGQILQKEAKFFENVKELKDELTTLLVEKSKIQQENKDLGDKIKKYIEKFQGDKWMDKSCPEKEEEFQNALKDVTRKSRWMTSNTSRRSKYGKILSGVALELFTLELHSPMEERERQSRSQKIEDDGVTTDEIHHVDQEQYEALKDKLEHFDEVAPLVIKQLEYDIFNIDCILRAENLENELFRFLCEQCKGWENPSFIWALSKSWANKGRNDILDQLKVDRVRYLKSYAELFVYLGYQSLTN